MGHGRCFVARAELVLVRAFYNGIATARLAAWAVADSVGAVKERLMICSWWIAPLCLIDARWTWPLHHRALHLLVAVKDALEDRRLSQQFGRTVGARPTADEAEVIRRQFEAGAFPKRQP